jgi:predicted TIM-barrel enzyme
MNKRFERGEIVERLRDTIGSGKPIVGAGCSAGLIARAAEVGGADLIICYSTGQSRIRGLQTVNIDHANPQTLSMYDEISNVVRDTPIIAGVEACDQTVYDLDELCRRFVDQGYDGVINFPTQGHGETFSPHTTVQNQQTGRNLGIPWGFAREVEMMRVFRERGLFTMCYVHSAEHAAEMVKAGVDVVCAHVGGTSGGLVGFAADPVDEALARAQKIMEGAWAVDSRAICLAHGGPFAEPEDTAALYEQTDAQGFVGASSIERIPVENAVMGALQGFKSHTVKKRKNR